MLSNVFQPIGERAIAHWHAMLLEYVRVLALWSPSDDVNGLLAEEKGMCPEIDVLAAEVPKMGIDLGDIEPRHRQ